MDLGHDGADDAFDDPAVMRPAGWSVAEVDAVLRATTLERFTFELGGVVDIQGARLSGHRPPHIRAEAQSVDPYALVRAHPAQTQPDRHCGRRIECDHEARHAAAEDIDSNREIWTSNRHPVVFIDDHQIDHGVINLDLLENRRHRRRDIARGLPRSGGVRSAT